MSQSQLAGKRIVLGVCGSVAAYKAADLVRRLRDVGASVRVVLTEAGAQFVGTATFQAVSGEPVRLDLWDQQAEAAMGHIELARWADLLLIAPATADVIARLAHGLADELLTTLALATTAPLVIAPAMNQAMWAHPATQANVETLRGRGVRVLGPDSGSQACGDVGAGRMLEPLAIIAELGIERSTVLQGRRLLISAGPTFEDLDPVRFLGNRSSGRMGFAIAEAAVAMAAQVTLVAGPVGLQTPAGVTRIDVRSAAQMREVVIAHADDADVYIGSAAVADYRPRQMAPEKIKKKADVLTVEFERTPDILAELGQRQPRPFLVGFAAETTDVEHYARDKLARKGLDMIAANDVSAGQGFECLENALTVFTAAGERLQLARTDKHLLARQLLALIAERLPEGAEA